MDLELLFFGKVADYWNWQHAPITAHRATKGRHKSLLTEQKEAIESLGKPYAEYQFLVKNVKENLSLPKLSNVVCNNNLLSIISKIRSGFFPNNAKKCEKCPTIEK